MSVSFGLFESAASSEQEAGIAKQAASDKLEAAVYDVRAALGPFLFQARSIEEFRDRVAMTKNDNSLYRLIEPHIHPAAGIVRRVAGRNGQLEKEFKAILATGANKEPVPARGQRRQACYPGCEKNEAHAKKFHNKESRRRQGTEGEGEPSPMPAFPPAGANTQHPIWGGSGDASADPFDPGMHVLADFDGTMDIKNTFKPSDGELIPKDDWEGYRNKVDQNSSKVDRNFTSSMEFRVYADWAEANQAHPMRLATLDAYAGNLSDAAYMRLARAIQAWEFEHKPKTQSGQSKKKLKDVTAAWGEGDPDLPPSTNDHLNMPGPAHHPNASGHYGPGDYAGNGPASAWNDDPDHEYKSQAEIDAQPKPHKHWQNDPKTHSYANRQASEYTDHMFGPGMGGPDHGEEAPADDSHLHHHRGPSWVKEPEDHWQNDPKTHSYANRRQSGPSPYGGVDDYMGEETGNELQNSEHMDPVTSFGGGPGGYPEPHHGRRDPLRRYIAWCDKNNLKRISARNVDHYSRGNPQLAIHLANRMKTAIHTARRRQGGHKTAAPDYLQKADDALTQLLNQKAEEFQNTIAPLQQALVTVQQAVQLTQQANPLNVLPPPGTVNVMPGQAAPGQVGQPDPSGGQDPAAAAAAALAPAQAAGQLPGGDPSGGGGVPPPDGGQGAPPPAAAAQGGLPPDPSQQMQARRRGGQGKGRGANRPRQANSVFDLWNKWQGQNTGVGGDADYDNFANQFGVGQQALNKLKTHHQQALVTAATDGKTPPNIAEEGVKQQWRMMDAQMSQAGYKFDKGSQHWTKSGQKPIKNPWPHSAGKQAVGGWAEQYHVEHPEESEGGGHDYRHEDPDQIFYPQRGHEGWGHESAPSGPPYVRDQPQPGRHEASSRKQAWTGWGPAQFPKTRKVAGWDWVENQNGYAAKSPRRFECSCGTDFPTPTGFHRCACGKSWNSYVIGTGGTNREASTDSFWVREIPTRPDVIVAANRRMEAFGFEPTPSGKHDMPFSGWGDHIQNALMGPSEHADPFVVHTPIAQGTDIYNYPTMHKSPGKPANPGRHRATVTLMDPRTGNMHDLVDPGELGEGKDPGHPKPKKITKDWHHRDKNQRWTGK